MDEEATIADAVMTVLSGFASVCSAPDDPAEAAAANAALRRLEELLVS